jgi:hypothetical protein
MNKQRWNSKVAVVALALGLLLVANPEIRALLLLADAIGIEAIAFLILVQARSLAPVAVTAMRFDAAMLCPALLNAAHAALYLLIGLLGSRLSLVSPVLAVATRLKCVQCPSRDLAT